MKNTDSKSDAALLRQKAEALLKKKSLTTTETDTLKLIHELEVHQIELEMQNEELRLANAAAQDATDKYIELYDFAPSGYVTLSAEGKIKRINLACARMLGKERSALIDRLFLLFINHDTKPIFQNFLRKVFESRANETCEVMLSKNGSAPLYVHLTGLVSEKSGHCLMTVTDIADRKMAEKTLRESEERLALAMDQAHLAYWEMDTATRTYTFNDRFYELYGTTAEREGGYRMSADVYAREFLLPEEQHIVPDDVARLLSGEANQLQQEHRIRRRDGELRNIIVRITVLRDTAGRVVGTRGSNQDITQRKQIEEKVLSVALRHEALLKNASDGIHILDKEGNVVEANDAFCRMLGYTREESLRLNVADWDMQWKGEELLEKVQEFTSTPTIFETRHRRKDGTVFDVEINATGITLEGRTYQYAAARDITERKRAEGVLRKSEKDYRQLFENATDVIVIFEPDQEIIFEANAAACIIYGYTHDELVGMSLKNFTKNVPAGEAQIKDTVESGSFQNFETIQFDKNGREIYFQINATLVEYRGRKAILSINRDITERKQAEESLHKQEETLRLAIDATSDGIWDWDIQSNKEYFSPRWCEIIGYSYDDPEFPHTYDSWLSRIHPEDKDYVITALHNHLEKGFTYDIEYRHLHKSGEYRWQKSLGNAISNENKKPIRMVGCIRDITERKRAEDKLRDSEDKYRLLVENQSDLVVKVDNAGNFLYVSPSYCNVFGKIESELIGNSFFPLVHEEDIQATQKGMENLYEPPYTCYIEQRAMTKTGWRWFSWSDTAELNADNEIISIIGVGRDITDRKHAEEALQNKERYQRALLDNFPFAVWLKDNESRFLAVNKMFAQTFGFPTPNALVGKTDFDIAAQDLAEGYRSDDLTVLESREKKNVEEEIVDQGVRKWFETYKAPVIDTNGELLGTVGFMRDINERKLMERALRESEERFRNVLQGVESVSIQGYSPDGTTQYWNRASELLYGYSAEEAIGRNLLDLIIPIEMRDGVEQAMLYMSETGQPIPASELSLRRKDGSRVFVYSSHTIVQIPGRQQELFCIDIDLTKRKATEQLLLDMQRRESLGILAGGIAHDFNNLLGSMMGNVSLAQANMPPGHPALKNMEKALSAMERAAHLTQQMLAYSGKGKFVLSTIDVGATVMEHKNLFTVSLPKNVKLITNIPSTPIHVNGDPGQIEQVVMNLIINGGEAVGDKQGVVSVSLSNVSMGAEELVPYGKLTNVELNSGIYALLEVKDSGRGMSLETLGKIFDPFFTTKFTGRGLGLAAVLGIIQGHQGGITVESDEGMGSTFRVLLPTSPAPVIAKEGETPGERYNTTVTTTILVIDDEADVIAMAQEILETEHYKVLVEMNPIKGIQLYKQRQTEVGVVLLDLTMPEMSGKEVVDALQAINPAVKIIISSGYSEDEVNKKIGKAKVSGFIQKPYRMKSLLSIVGSVLY